MIVGKGIAYVKPFDSTLPLRPVEIELRITNVVLRSVIYQNVPLNSSMVRKLDISMPDQRVLFRLITQNISQLTHTYMTE